MNQINIDRVFAQAEHAADAGHWASARTGYLQVLAEDPGHADAMLQLSYVESFAGNHRIAHDWAMRAASSTPPRRPESRMEMVRRLRTFHAAHALKVFAEDVLCHQPGQVLVLVEAARQLSNLNVFDTALRCAELALSQAPNDLSARLVHGQLLAHHGDNAAAEAEIESVLKRNPNIAIGWWMLARLRRQTPESNHVARIRQFLRLPGLRPDDIAAAARALHKELDDLGDYEAAWQALETMCRARRVGMRYTTDSSRKLVDALLRWSKGRGPVAGASVVAAVEPTPVFIVGMHRSGTTLLEQLLSGNPQVRGLGELNDFSAAMRLATDHASKDVLDHTMVERAATVDFESVGRCYRDAVAWRLEGAACFTDKQPANFLNIGFILSALPDARVLHLVRDPVETCFSNLRELYSGINPFSYDQRELAAYFGQYLRLMRHWHTVFPGRILDVPYAGLTGDTQATMGKVAAYCGIEYLPGMSDPRSKARAVSTASSVQVRDRIVREETPKWKHYERHLQPLLQGLGKAIE